jgi:hypothetical protein
MTPTDDPRLVALAEIEDDCMGRFQDLLADVDAIRAEILRVDDGFVVSAEGPDLENASEWPRRMTERRAA